MTSPHAIIAVFFLSVFVCVCVFLFLALAPEHAPARSHSESRASIAGLSVDKVCDLEVFFGDRDYLALRSRPELKPVCAKFLRDRRRITLLWLGELQNDVRLVWEFRRFLVRNGLPVTFREEVSIASGACFALLYLAVARAVVLACGPIALSRAIRTARVPVQRLSTRGADLLANIPAAVRAQIEQRWSRHVLVWNMG